MTGTYGVDCLSFGAVFAVSSPTWNNRSCPHEADEIPDFIVDGPTELVLLDGNNITCLPPLDSNRSYLRLYAYVYTPMTKYFVLEMLVTDLGCESPGILVYYERKCAHCDESDLLQCRLNGSTSGVIACRFACFSPFQLEPKNRVVIQIEILPWEVIDTLEPKICGLTTIIPQMPVSSENLGGW